MRKVNPNAKWTVWTVLKWLAILSIGTMVLGNFLVKSPFWGYGDQIVKTYRSITTVCPGRRRVS